MASPAAAKAEKQEKAAKAVERKAKTGAFQRVAAITIRSISLKDMEEGDALYFRALDTILDKPDMDKQGKQKIDPDTGEAQFLHILRVVDLTDESGEPGEIVIGHIVNRNLVEMAERGQQYVGKCFEMVKGPKKGRTNMWSLYEIADPDTK